MAKRSCKLALVFLLVLGAVPAVAAPVTVMWDPNPESDIVSYIVHWGTRPGIYTNRASVDGRTTSWLSPDLRGGRTYYFAVQAVNADGLSSPYSEEASISVTGVWRAVMGDFSGSGTANFSVFRRDRGQWLIRDGTSVAFGNSTDIPVVGDYDGDGLSDIALWRPSTGVWSVLHSSDGYQFGSMLQVQWGAGHLNDVPVPADYDGDGRTDIAVWRPGPGTWYILLSRSEYDTAQALVVQWGAGRVKDVPVPADYDGDGAADLAVWRAQNGTWYILPSSEGFATSAARSIQWGAGRVKDVPAPGDYDGDGASDLAVWRPGTGVWYILLSSEDFSTGAAMTLNWGAGSRGDVPVPADFDGDGTTDIAVWRPSNGTWYVLQSSQRFASSGALAIQWGSLALHDLPVTGTVPLAATKPALAGYASR